MAGGNPLLGEMQKAKLWREEDEKKKLIMLISMPIINLLAVY